MPRQPRLEEVDELGGPFEMQGMAGVGNDRQFAARKLSRQALGDVDVLAVPFTGDDEYRRRDLVETFPQGVLGAGACQQKARRQTLGIGRPALARRCRQAGEHRLSEPLVEEGLGAEMLDAQRQVGVTGEPGGALVGILDASVCAHEHQSAYDCGLAECEVKREPSPQRVAGVHTLALGAGDERGGIPEARSDIGARSVAGQIGASHLVTFGEYPDDAVPGRAGLGEPVEQDEP